MASDKINMDFMIVMCEMSVMFYDHYLTRKLISFENYCDKVCMVFEDPDINFDKAGYYSANHEQLMIFLQLELESQYGIVGGKATKIIVDFYTNRYWVGIYKSQSKVNKSLFPDGYYKKLNKGL